MRKLYSVLLFLFLTTILQAQIINFPDAKFKAKLLSANALQGIAYDVNLHAIRIDSNGDNEIQLAEALQVYDLNLNNQAASESEKITDLTGIEAFTNLRKLQCEHNRLTFLNVSALINMRDLYCTDNLITSLNLDGLTNLQHLICRSNNISAINFNQLTSIEDLVCDDNELTTVDINGLLHLKQLYVGNNNISYLNVVNCPQIFLLWCYNNHIPVLNLNHLTTLQSVYCQDNLLTTLDTQNLTVLASLLFSNNPQLVSVFMKNGLYQGVDNMAGLNNLRYICVDEEEAVFMQNGINANNYSNCSINTYCSFNPGGVYYTVHGNHKFDTQGNGCDNNDLTFPFLKFSITNGVESGEIVSDISGSYSLLLGTGSHTITPVLENPTYFNVTPSSLEISFPTQASPHAQNFCITPNGIHQDLEIWIVPVGPARPGFDSTYKIMYKNKGNTTVSGHLTFAFDDDHMDFLSALPLQQSQSFSLLSWNYSNLLPYETREIQVRFNINSPMETPAVNIDDVLKFGATIFPLTGDENVNDNSNRLHQIVVGSLDPNDKICVEGAVVEPEIIGDYVHYVIRFENTGTFAAENIVVKDVIDAAKFDIASLVPLNSSHSFVTRISGNKVEFIFENINLPFNDENNDGYVVFKIKTKPTLVIGDTFSNSASIYFDYNFPIVTDVATSTIQALKNQDFNFSDYFSLYPNPANDLLHLQPNTVVSVNSVSIYNVVGQLLKVVTAPIQHIDVSDLKPGNYFIRITTDKGTASSRFVKK